MNSLNLGSLIMGVRLDFAQIDTDKAKLVSSTGDLRTKLQTQMQGLAVDIQAKFGAAANAIGNQFMGMGAGILAGLGGAIKIGEDWNQKLLQIAANTGMSDAELKQMTATVEDMGTKVGVPLQQLADGYMHISNFGYKAADANHMLDVASKSAASTGADAGKTANLLAATIHEFSIPVAKSAQVMSTLQEAAAKSNATLAQFVDAAGPVYGVASNMGVSFQDATAALAALTQHGYNMAGAATQILGILPHIATHTNKVTDKLKELSKASGVDLVADFTRAGLRAKGFHGILEDVAKAAHNLKLSAKDIAADLIPAARGGRGFQALVGSAMEDYNQRLKEANANFNGDGKAATEAYGRAQNSLAFQIQRARNEMTIMAREVETALLPALRPIVANVRQAVDWFSHLSPGVKTAAIEFTAAAGAGLLFVGMGLKMVAAIASVSSAVTALAGAFPALGASIAGLATPVGLAIGLVAALAGAVASVKGDIDRVNAMHLQRGTPEGEAASKKAREDPVYNVERRQTIKDEQARLRYKLSVEQDPRNIMALKAQQLHLGLLRSENEADIHKAVQGPPVPPEIAAKNDADKAAAAARKQSQADWLRAQQEAAAAAAAAGKGNAERAAQQAKDEAEKRLQADRDVQDKLFDLTHSDKANKIKDAAKEFAESRANGVTYEHARDLMVKKIQLAEQEYQLGLKTAAQKKELDRQTITDDTAKIGMNEYDKSRLAAQREYEAGMRSDASNQVQLKARLAAQLKEIDEKQAADYRREAEEVTRWDQQELQKQYEEADRQAAEKKTLAQEALQAQLALEERWLEYKHEMGIIDEQQYRDGLQRQLGEYEAYSEKWMQISERIHKIDEETKKKKDAPKQKEKDDQKKHQQEIQDQMQGIFASGFEKIFQKGNKGFKGMFQSILDGFKDMLIQMLAQWAANQAAMLAMKGLTSLFGGPLGFLGFDDAGNDRKAFGWGQDFMQHFSAGMVRHQQLYASAGATGAAGGGDHYHTPVHIHNPVINHPVDIDHLAQQVSYKVARGMQGYRRGTGS